MSEIHRVRRQEVSIARALPEGETRRSALRGLLRPSLVETGALIADIFLIVIAGIVCSVAYYWTISGGTEDLTQYVGVSFIIAANFSAIMTARQNYHLKRLIRPAKQIREVIIVWSGTYGLLAAVAFTMKISGDFSRGSLLLFFAGGLTSLVISRWFIAGIVSRSLANGSFARKKVIVIAERGLDASSRALKELQRWGYYPVRTCEITSAEISAPGIAPSLLTKLGELVEAARSEKIEDIYLLVRWHHHRIVEGVLDSLAVLPITVHLVPDEDASRFLSYPMSNAGNTLTAVLKRAPLTRAELMVKRCFDLVFAAAALLTLLPLMTVTALLIKLNSRGPVLFRQRRDGFNGGTFDIYKFRTMHVLEDGPVVRQATRDDPRVTRLGRWLRRSSIDELPQLFNVLSGEMSLVGPRPHPISFYREYEKLIANYAFRHHVKPGLTGWAQVHGYRGETRQVAQMEQRVKYDLWYINNWSILLDLRILLRTVVVTMRQDAAY